MIVAVEAAVDAVIFAIVCDVERRKEIDRIAKVLACFKLCFLRHLFKERGGGRRKQSLEIFNGASVAFKGSLYVTGCVLAKVYGIHMAHNLVVDVGLDDFHALHVFHVICAGTGVGLDAVLAFQSLRRQSVGINKITFVVIFFFRHKNSTT